VRVAVVVGTFPVLSETFILEQITGLIDRGLSVDVFAFSRGDCTRVHADVLRYRLLDRVTFPAPLPSGWARRAIQGSRLAARHLHRDAAGVLRSLNAWRYGRPASALTLLQHAAPHFGRADYDVVHCHYGPIGVHTLTLRELGVLRGRLVTTFHGFDASVDVRRQGDGVYRRLFQECDLVLAVSLCMRRKLVELGCDDAKAVVHRVGVDCDRFAFRARAGTGGPVRIASVSRLVEKKGLEYAIRAVAKLAERGLSFEYRIAGDGERREAIARLVSELGLGDRVRLLGPLTHEGVAELLAETQVFLAPSTVTADGDEEGVPTGIMEAMAMGIPVVSTVHSGIPELVEDGVSGLLAPERDVAGIAERLAHLVTHPDAWAPMGRAGRARVERDFDIRRLNDDLVRHYERLARAPGRVRDGREAPSRGEAPAAEATRGRRERAEGR
jgi:colanic acid/amylovoran biosynthesis glycosyltransferase